MVRAWYMDDDTTVDQRQPHMLDPPKFVELPDLEKIGVLYYKVSFSSKIAVLLVLTRSRHRRTTVRAVSTPGDDVE